MKQANNVDEYISEYPVNVQEILQKLRQTVKESAPDAEELISYRIPAYRLNGNLVYFGAFKDHIGFYPTSSGISAFKKELSKYKVSRGTVQFPIDQPIPYDLVRKITRHRVRENLGKK